MKEPEQDIFSDISENKDLTQPPQENKSRKHLIIRIFLLILVIAISVFIFIYRDKAEQFAVYGYPGVFIIAFSAYATVLLPAPGVLIIFVLASILNPWIVALLAGTGAACGELVGFLGGYTFKGVIQNRNYYERISFWMQKNAPITILLLSAIPNPFFDLAGLVAGAFRIPFRRFFFWCWIGEMVKMLGFSLLGKYSFNTLQWLLN
jgi:membrane protein YqaA with SNARE-associated domain